MLNINIVIFILILIILTMVIITKSNESKEYHFEKIKWNEKLKDLELNGQKYPNNIKKRFFFQTSYCNSNLDLVYKEKFIESDELEKLQQDYSSFNEYIKNADNKYVTSFYNKSNDTLLIIPIPDNGKNYTTMKDFIDNADNNKQKIYFKYVSNKIKEFLQTNEKVYVSTHGLNVPYFHLRLCSYPKYYIKIKINQQKI